MKKLAAFHLKVESSCDASMPAFVLSSVRSRALVGFSSCINSKHPDVRSTIKDVITPVTARGRPTAKHFIPTPKFVFTAPAGMFTICINISSFHILCFAISNWNKWFSIAGGNGVCWNRIPAYLYLTFSVTGGFAANSNEKIATVKKITSTRFSNWQK